MKYDSIFRLVLRCLLVARKENSTGFSTGLTGRSKNLDPTGAGWPDRFPSLDQGYSTSFRKDPYMADEKSFGLEKGLDQMWWQKAVKDKKKLFTAICRRKKSDWSLPAKKVISTIWWGFRAPRTEGKQLVSARRRVKVWI